MSSYSRFVPRYGPPAERDPYQEQLEQEGREQEQRQREQYEQQLQEQAQRQAEEEAYWHHVFEAFSRALYVAFEPHEWEREPDFVGEMVH